MSRTLCLAVTLLATATSSAARADPPRFDPPAPPDALPPALALDVHVSLLAPLANTPLCPGTATCVLHGGGGIGVAIERRWAWGATFGVAYDAWFVDSGGVYELGVVQSLQARVRWLFARSTRVHPLLGVGLGAVTLGDGLRVATVGGALTVLGGLEVELTEALAVVLSVPWSVFVTAPFTTTSDRTARAEHVGLNATVAVELGLVIVDVP